MAHKPLSLGKVAEYEESLMETRQLRQSYAAGLFKLHEKARSLQGEEVLMTGRLQTIGGIFLTPDSPAAAVDGIKVIIKYVDVIDWDEHDATPLPYLYLVAWSPAHDQTITAAVNEQGVSLAT